MFSDGGSPVEGDVTHTLRTAQKKPIEMTLIPVTVPHRQLLFFFHPPLDPMDKAAHPYVLTIQNQVHKSLSDIASGEHISLTSDRAENMLKI
jgi:hypothetical protein